MRDDLEPDLLTVVTYAHKRNIEQILRYRRERERERERERGQYLCGNTGTSCLLVKKDDVD